MKRYSVINFFWVILVPIIFLLVSLLTLGDYGINWDEPKHLIRGQVYLHYILTGKHDFLDLPPYRQMQGAPDYVDYNVEQTKDQSLESALEKPGVRRSYFQSDFYTFNYFMAKHVHTHPEVNDLLLAFTNYVFFQRLGVVDDIEAYHLFIVLVTFALIVGIGLWVYDNFGIFASIIATSSLSLYPLVFAESHFNVKDPILMSFFGLAILSFWYGCSRSKSVYILLSALFAGFALGTKFNTLFLPLILAPWLVFNLVKAARSKKKFQVFISILAYPFIVLAVLYIFSPYLWIDPIGHFMEIVNYYKSIGTEPLSPEMSRFLVGGWNIYPLFWIFYTTPLPILFLFILGFCYALFLLLKRQDDVAFLVLLWFTIPIARVVWPGANIYGGVRQIMEFLPAMAVLSSIGAFFLARQVGLRLAILLVFVSFGFVIYEIARIHPNQNVYFNQLVGGLSGAKEKKIPSWGNSYGNVYLQGINWLNQNAEPDAKLALPIQYISSIPRLKLRKDIDLDNSHWSGAEHKGEYIMEMYYDWPLMSRYKYAYYENFLSPVYQVTIDGIPLLKIWKNDIEHVKGAYKKEIILKPISISVEDQKLKLDFGKEVFLTKLIIDHSTSNCEEQGMDGFISVSQNGKDWIREPNPLYDPESPYVLPDMDEDTFVYQFAARPAVSLIFNLQKDNSCILKNFKVTIWGLAK